MENKLKTDDMVAYRKQYYQENKDNYKKTVKCDICEHSYKIYSKSQHMKLKKHKDAMEKQKLLKELESLKNKLKNCE